MCDFDVECFIVYTNKLYIRLRTDTMQFKSDSY